MGTLDPREALRQRQLEAKLAANSLIPDPIPTTEVLLGPSLSKFVDPQSMCTIGDIHHLNEAVVFSTVEELKKSTFFKFFKVDLDAECPYWVIDKICKNGGSCTIGRCEEDEIPACVRDFDSIHRSQTALPTGKVLPAKLPASFSAWDDVDENMWAHTQLDSCNPHSSYVDLLENVESNTGYAGEEPRMIWNAIYNENCFRAITSPDVQQMCFEERLFYRLISGIHTEISVHVFAKWKRDPFTLDFVPNKGLWNIVFGKFPERFDSLYYTLNFLTESLHAMEPHKNLIKIATGNAAEDEVTKKQFDVLLSATNPCNFKAVSSLQKTEIPEYVPEDLTQNGKNGTKTRKAVVTSKDEDEMKDNEAHAFPSQPLFQTTTSIQLRDQLKSMFRNVSLIMNCVGCEKCRVWSKLHTLGIATALKVSLAKPGAERKSIVASLQRNELVSLVNSIASFSEAVNYVSKFMDLQPNPNTLDHSTPFEADNSISNLTRAEKIKEAAKQAVNSLGHAVQRGSCTVVNVVHSGLRRVGDYLPFFRHFPSNYEIERRLREENKDIPIDDVDEEWKEDECRDLESVSVVYTAFSLFLVAIAVIVSFFRCDGDNGTKGRTPGMVNSSGVGYREFYQKPFGNEINAAQQAFEEEDDEYESEEEIIDSKEDVSHEQTNPQIKKNQ